MGKCLMCKLCVATQKFGKPAYCKKRRRSVEAAETNANAQASRRSDGMSPAFDHFKQHRYQETLLLP